MYWINLPKLEKQLKANRLSDSNALDYIIANVIVTTLAVYTIDDPFNGLDNLNVLPILIIAFLGIRYNFNAYSRLEGKNFFKFYWALYWVISIRVVLFVLFFLLVVMPVILYLIGNSTYANALENVHLYLNNPWLDSILGSFCGILCYTLLNRSLKRVASNSI